VQPARRADGRSGGIMAPAEGLPPSRAAPPPPIEPARRFFPNRPGPGEAPLINNTR
jgi:hypothetical protein